MEKALSVIQDGDLKSPSEAPELEAASESTRDNTGDNAEANSVGTGDDSPWEISSDSSRGRDLGEQNVPPAVMTSFSTSRSSTLIPSDTNEDGETEIGRLFQSIQFTNACLRRLPLRKPALLDRLTHRTSLDTSPYQHFDALYVQDKFPLLDAGVATRLGKMITRRRQLLRYRVTHQERLTGLNLISKSLPRGTINEDAHSQSLQNVEGGVDIVSERYETASSKHTLQTKATTLKIELTTTEEQMYTPSVAESKSSLASSYTSKEMEVEIPPRPKDADGKALHYFECPYCALFKHIKTNSQWK